MHKKVFHLSNRPSFLMEKLAILRSRFQNFRSTGEINRCLFFDDEIENPTQRPPLNVSQHVSEATVEKTQLTDLEFDCAEVTEVTDHDMEVDTTAEADTAGLLPPPDNCTDDADAEEDAEAEAAKLLRQITSEVLTDSQIPISQIEMAMWTPYVDPSQSSDASDDNFGDQLRPSWSIYNCLTDCKELKISNKEFS